MTALHVACLRSEPGLLGAGDPFSPTERCVSNDSIEASSGEVSPYDNNSPVLSDRLLCKYPEDSGLSERDPRLSGQFKLSSRSKDGSGSASPTLSTDKGELPSFAKCTLGIKKKEEKLCFLLIYIYIYKELWNSVITHVNTAAV